MDRTEVIRVLDEAKALVEKGWYQGYYARDAEGRRVEPEDASACAFCIVGAVMRVAGREHTAHAALEAVTPGGYTADYNDYNLQTKEEALAMFDKAKAWVNEQADDARKILDDAKALIEKGWHQGYYVRDVHGKRQLPTDANAVAFCAIGALERAGSDQPVVALAIAKKALRLAVPEQDVVGFNDAPGRTKEEVVAVFEAAKGWVLDEKGSSE